MKKLLLTVSALLTSLSMFAQLTTNGEGFLLDYTLSTSQCNLNGTMPNNGGLLVAGGNFQNGATNSIGGLSSNAGPLTLVANTSISSDYVTPIWFSFPAVSGSSCSDLIGTSDGIDMSADANAKIEFTVSANASSKIINFFLATGNGQSTPYSLYNPGDGVSYITLTCTTSATANSDITVTFDLKNLTATTGGSVDQNNGANFWAGPTVGSQTFPWAGRSNIQSWGARIPTGSAGTTFSIKKIRVGDAIVTSNLDYTDASNLVSVYPNPSKGELNVNLSSLNGESVVKLLNANGTEVYNASANGSAQINTASYNKGMYMLQVINNNKVYTQKVVVE